MNCKTETRRALVRANRSADGQQLYNGLDYVEVSDDQLTLVAYFLGKLPAELKSGGQPTLDHLRLEGGERVKGIRLTGAEAHPNPDPERDDYLALTVDQPGDFSTYTLRLVGVSGIDPRYDHADFSFKAGCATDLDCAAAPACPTPALAEPDLNYLAKDYASFRQLILDRLAVIMPDWQERHAPDLEIALVEVLAYVGDHLSYYQDAVGTEAYLNTARQRISVRRHARLVDYLLHEGNNARAWVCVTTNQDLPLTAGDYYFITTVADSAQISGRAVTENDLRSTPASAYEVFEPLGTDDKLPLPLRVAHNEILFYTWGDRECCLPRGATAATLLDQWVYVDNPPPVTTGPAPTAARPAAAAPALDPTTLKRALNLAVGDVLVFEEVLGPKTGQAADADPRHRYPVRLTKVSRAEDPVRPTPLVVNDQTYTLATPVVEIEWDPADKLPNPLCLTAIGPAPDCVYLDPVSVAHGNVVLVDHGHTLPAPEYLGQVPLLSSEAICECEGEPGDVRLTSGRFEPRLSKTPLTFRQALPAGNRTPASQALAQDPRKAVPSIKLLSIPGKADGSGPVFTWADLSDATHLGESLARADSPLAAVLNRGLRLAPRTQRLLTTDANLGSADYPDVLCQALQADLRAMLDEWTPRFDLLESGPDDAHFVVEMDNDGVAHLRFGDGELGRRPSPGSAFYAVYRVGNGARGNVGAGAITQLVSCSTLDGPTLGVRNPLPALGGTEPEPLAEAKLYAPTVFKQRLERAITADDYAQIAKRDFAPALQQAAAELAWTGSWYEAEVALDPRGLESTSAPLADAVADRLERYRRLGHDLRVEPARYVPLDIVLTVCVQPHYLRGEVEAALLDVFTAGLRASGQPGFFHPDQFTFGGGVYLSRLVAAAQAVPGVESVTVTRLERLFEGPNHEIEDGVLPLGALEVARVDNDPNYPEHGRFALVMQGGR